VNYIDFLESKKHVTEHAGFDPVYMPDQAFDYQQALIHYAVKRGRMAVFADTGLGKTLIQLSIAKNIVAKHNKKVLILTPLAVAFQFLKEAEFLGIPDVEHTKDGKHSAKIVICNYERMHLLNSSDFEGVILDESSILKNFDGKIKKNVLAFIKKVRYRFLSTATPSPNDYIELGNSSEALGFKGFADVLGTFFTNNQKSTDTRNRNIGEKYYLKPHAENDFFSWVNQWAVMIKKPSDLGASFDDSKHTLPPLIRPAHIVPGASAPALTFTELRAEQKNTLEARCEKAAELSVGRVSVYWCNLNDESSRLKALDPDATEILGSMSVDRKEAILIDFYQGNIPRIITKAKMTGMGLNWQHCNNSVFFPTYSYEQYYQAVRRFWRFGQKSPVTFNIVLSEGQSRVMQALDEKAQKAEALYSNLLECVSNPYNEQIREFEQKIILPEFLK